MIPHTNITFGTRFFYNVSEDWSVMYGQTWTETVSLSLDNIVEGEYLISWHCIIWSTLIEDPDDTQVRIQIDDSNPPIEDVITSAPKNNATVVSGFYKTTLTTGSHFIDIDFRGVLGLNQASIEKARLMAWRIT